MTAVWLLHDVEVEPPREIAACTSAEAASAAARLLWGQDAIVFEPAQSIAEFLQEKP